MTREQKELLLKDLCARLPYGVIVEYEGNLSKLDTIFMCDSISISSTSMDKELSYNLDLDEVKPYLFPLSSMTDKQKREISKRYNYYNLYQSHVEITNHSEGYWDNDNSCNLQDYLWLEDWFNKNHFDYRGLIPMGLAIDATGLNIY